MSDQRERGNLAAFEIASVTSFLRNDTLFNAFVKVRSRSVTFLLRAGSHIASLASLPDSPVSPVLLSRHRDLILDPRRSEERADRSELAAIDRVWLPLMKKQQERPTGLINSFDFLVDSGYAFYMMSDRVNLPVANTPPLRHGRD